MILFKVIRTPFVAGWAQYQQTSAFRHGARWNSPGQPAMYLASNAQNAMLEIANYAVSPRMANTLYRLVVFEFPATRLYETAPDELPPRWNERVHHSGVQQFGDRLLRQDDYEGFRVPTVALPTQISLHPRDTVRTTANLNVVLHPPRIALDRVKILDSVTPVFSSAMFGG